MNDILSEIELNYIILFSPEIDMTDYLWDTVDHLSKYNGQIFQRLKLRKLL